MNKRRQTLSGEAKPGPRHCINCGSSRRVVKAHKLCAKCYYWTGRLIDFNDKLEALMKLSKDKQGSESGSLKFRIRVARKALEELKWREDCLNAESVSVWTLRSLACALARDCGSTVEEASLQEFENLEPSARKRGCYERGIIKTSIHWQKCSLLIPMLWYSFMVKLQKAQ